MAAGPSQGEAQSTANGASLVLRDSSSTYSIRDQVARSISKRRTALVPVVRRHGVPRQPQTAVSTALGVSKLVHLKLEEL